MVNYEQMLMKKQLKSELGPAIFLLLIFTPYLFIFFQFCLYLSKFLLKYCEIQGVSMDIPLAFQPDPENTSTNFKFIWILFHA